MEEDITDILREWEHDPSRINARRITGKDGKPKIQIRLDLGLLQMEADGRPDGQTPNGFESLLEYHLARLATYERRESSDSGFFLDSEDCRQLGAEATQYYYRYLCFFALEDLERAERDTARNLRVFDLVSKYAAHDSDKRALDQYRPYVITMNARARASIALRDGDFSAALRHIEDGMAAIERFFVINQEHALLSNSAELAFLTSWASQIRDSRPLPLDEELRLELKAALEKEDYEAAARLRDEITNLGRQEPRH